MLKAVLCDDDKTTTLILKHLLEKAGFQVAMASNGQEGLTRIQAEKPQLVILDLDMPMKNGIAVLEALKAEGETLPYILVLSAHEDAQTAEQAKRLGARDVVVKPYHPGQFIERLRRLRDTGEL